MVEIYSYDITAHERFARDKQEVEAFQKQYHIAPSGAQAIAIQTKILDFVPKHTAVVLLMQTYQRKMWARFMIPKNYYSQRFSSSYVAPSMGPIEKQNADMQRIELVLKKRKELQRKEQQEREEKEEEETTAEGEALLLLLEKGVKETNTMVDFVTSRMMQFVQA